MAALLLAGALLGGCQNPHRTASDLALTQPAAGDSFEDMQQTQGPGRGFAGAYLSSHFAQTQSDWWRASLLLDNILLADPDNPALLRQGMILAIGAGDFETAAARAAQVLRLGQDDTLAGFILAAKKIKDGAHDEAESVLRALPGSGMGDVIAPLLLGWATAGQGKFDPEIMAGSTMHAFHGGAIAVYLKQKPEQVRAFANLILSPNELGADDVERAADLLAVAGQANDARHLYKALQAQQGGSAILSQKLARVEQDQSIVDLVPALSAQSAAQGAALALLDVAQILAREDIGHSARVFAQIVLGLDPEMVAARFLIAESYAQGNNIDEALRQYDRIPPDHGEYRTAMHKKADILAAAGRVDEAENLLRTLFETFADPETLIRLGDVYRVNGDFAAALRAYERVSGLLPDPLPPNHWYLAYARGMVRERLGDWTGAESDLKLALALRPDNPYIMNYLAYGWADQGINLGDALSLLENAALLRPGDGHITDSLGWVHYRMGNYNQAVPYLERAVEMLPYDPIVNDHLGDAYWRAGRKIEARFQWQRARNATQDDHMISVLSDKLANGLAPPSHSETSLETRIGSSTIAP